MKNTKRLVSLFLSGIIIFSLVSCGLTDNIKNKMIDSDSKNTFSYAVNNGNLELFKELCEKYITSGELEMYRDDGSIYRKRLGVSPDKLQIVKI